MESKEWQERKKLITTRIFVSFVIVSLLALVYFNITPKSDLVAMSLKFPEIGDTMQKTFVRTYKIAISAAIFLIDIILVGPFAYIAYFGDHIKPIKGKLLNLISFFDFGVLLALWFTLTIMGAHFQVLYYVRKIHSSPFISPTSMLVLSEIAFGVWIIALLLKFYTYTPDQRKELKKYAIRF